MQPKPVAFAAPASVPTVPPRHDYADPTHYIPPAPTLPQRSQRMPQVEDLPPQIQNQLRAHRGEAPSEPTPVEAKRRTLLERLASFGMSRHDEPSVPHKPVPARSATPAPAPMPTQAAGAPRQVPPTPAHAEFAKRPPQPAARQVPVDQHGRQAAAQRHHEEDQLEIPAFLRRQSN